MSIRISLPDISDLKPKILVVGVGGAGVNATNNMISSNLEGVEFWVANTDSQSLDHSLATNKIQLGAISTKGLGAGSHPEVGKIAAEESIDHLIHALDGANMVFVAAGMGGGTGTGAAPVIAKAAKERDILVIGVVTKPFHFEGIRRMKVAELGLEEMENYVDTLIVIPNQNLFRIANEKTTFADAFKTADDVLRRGVQGITDLINMPGLINLDFADIKTVMSEKGKAMMGTGEAEGDNRAVKAAEAAISNPLLDNSSMKGAKGVLINITGGMDMTLFEVDEAATRIKEEVDPNANVIFGSAFNSDLEGKIRVSIVATGIDISKRFSQPQHISQPIQNIESVVHKEDASSGLGQYFIENPKIDEEVARAFIPSRPIDPEQDMIVSQAAEENVQATANITKTLFEEDDSNNTANVKTAKKNDLFDIPAFLRRKIGGNN